MPGGKTVGLRSPAPHARSLVCDCESIRGGHGDCAAGRHSGGGLLAGSGCQDGLLETKPGAWAERLHFASLIAATALIRHLPGSTPEEKVEFLIKKVVDATKHATQAVHVITALYLWERFARG